MDKYFTPNKWFVLFCAVFIGIFATLQWIVRARVEAAAKQVAEEVFTWVWLDKNLCASADMTKAKIIKLTENDAIVELSGDQTVCPFDEPKPTADKVEKSHCQATLTFYKLQNNWVLGRVELQ